MKKTIISALALSASVTAFAGDMGTIQSSNFYLQAEGGYSELNTASNLLANSGVDKGDFGYGLRAGYLFPMTNGWSLGLDGGYINLGETKYNGVSFPTLPTLSGNVKIKQDGFDLLAVAKKQINPNVDVFGKAGFAYIDQKADVSIAGFANNVNVLKKTKFLPEIAGGVAYDINQNVAITGTVSHIFGDKLDANASSNAVASSTSALVGLRYTFG